MAATGHLQRRKILNVPYSILVLLSNMLRLQLFWHRMESMKKICIVGEKVIGDTASNECKENVLQAGPICQIFCSTDVLKYKY